MMLRNDDYYSDQYSSLLKEVFTMSYWILETFTIDDDIDLGGK
jgi:hypothetical protein